MLTVVVLLRPTVSPKVTNQKKAMKNCSGFQTWCWKLKPHQPLSNSNNTPPPPQLLPRIGFPEKRRRGRNPVDKEYKRLKRLLRNRVSAQQTRERKKVYVCDLESRAKQLKDINSKLEENISTLINENTMLRKVLINTRPKVDQSIEPKNDIPSEH